MPCRPWLRRLRRGMAAIAALGVLLALTPPGRSALKGVLLVLQVASPVHPLGWLSREPSRREVRLESGDVADLYRPRGLSDAPGVVVVPGANPEGKNDPDLVAFASALARSGRRVMVPELELRHRRLDLDDRRRIGDAVTALAGAGKAGVLAFSYGAGLSLVAVGDSPAVQRHVAFVATIGTYYDPAHLVQGVTTGVVPDTGGEARWEAAPEARDLFAAQLALFLGGTEGPALTEAWRRQDPAGLTPEAGAAYALLANRDPARYEELFRQLPLRVAELFTAVSPARVAGAIRVPVFALHDHDDPASPPAESRLLVEAVGAGARARLTEVGLFDHVRPVEALSGRLGDGVRLGRFAARILRVQEGWPRP
jgi:hypothetical protein